MTEILIVDDEESIRNVVKAYLEADGFTVHTAEDGSQALALSRRYHPQLVVLDIMLPGIDGFEVLQQMRRESGVYVLLLTARSEEVDRVVGLTIGADDYVTKPFSPRELVARIKAILRRDRDTVGEEAMLVFNDLRIDTNRFEVWRGDYLIDLTVSEFKILAVLARSAGVVFSRDRLIEKVWGYDSFLDLHSVDVYIRRIRQKLEVDPANPHFILTVRGVGYKFGETRL
ncbi:MAG: response regulator transcription factor [Anaerolineae bacterium]|nr:response regulator transcription factor [Anaerolineae bacterium]NUQ07270.1 response regulator transcription factor [Anaerolineae bacterium]